MATSGVTAWSMTARDIIQTALEENGIVPLGEAPEAEEAAACMRRLNGILKSWRWGMHLEAQADVTIPADSASGTVAGDVNEIIGARYVESATNERLLARWERDQYLSLPNKTASGTPTIFYVQSRVDTLTLYVWPVPTAEATIKVDYLRKPETITDLSETVDFPQKYQEALYANLAVQCAGLFGATPSPELVARAAMLKLEMDDAERPASYYMGAC